MITYKNRRKDYNPDSFLSCTRQLVSHAEISRKSLLNNDVKEDTNSFFLSSKKTRNIFDFLSLQAFHLWQVNYFFCVSTKSFQSVIISWLCWINLCRLANLIKYFFARNFRQITAFDCRFHETCPWNREERTELLRQESRKSLCLQAFVCKQKETIQKCIAQLCLAIKNTKHFSNSYNQTWHVSFSHKMSESWNS